MEPCEGDTSSFLDDMGNETCLKNDALVDSGPEPPLDDNSADVAGCRQSKLVHFGECLPLESLHALLSWEPRSDYVSRSMYMPSERLDKRRRIIEGNLRNADDSRILCCHDMMGGYLDDRYVMGRQGNENGYTFRHWQSIDGFVYFSHRFITIPPSCWVNAGHRHGCPVYGTVITEWDAGQEMLAEMLSSRSILERSVQQLVNIALYHKFDGWLVNIENEIDEQLVEALLEFVRLLTEAMHRAIGHSKVIWYDAVTIEGKLQWQNGLTKLNKPFFDRCDGIWINYGWKEGDPNSMRDAAGERRQDVYAGIDCFGRGTHGGGGLNTFVAVEAAKNAAIGVGLFAQAWPYQHYIQDSDTDRIDKGTSGSALQELYPSWYEFDEEFWYRIDRVSNQRRPTVTSLPFSTDFSSGWGSAYYSGGTLVGKSSWYNMSLQSLQSAPWLYDSHHSNIYTCHISRGTAFNRSGCFVVEGGIGEPIRVRLLQTMVPLKGRKNIDGLGLKCTAATSKGINLRIALKISKHGERSKDSIIVELDTAVAQTPSGRSASLASTFLIKPPSKQLKSGKVALNDSEQDVTDVKPLDGGPWITSEFGVLGVDLPWWVFEEGWITDIDAIIRPVTSGSMCKCHVALGNLTAWFLGEEFPPCSSVAGLFPDFVDLIPVYNAHGGVQLKKLNLLLVWEAPKNVNRFQVWYKTATKQDSNEGIKWSSEAFLVALTVPVYVISDLELGADVVAVRFHVLTEVGPTVQASRSNLKHVTLTLPETS
jgi:endo-beta-N-acetylglucosaminidase D